MMKSHPVGKKAVNVGPVTGDLRARGAQSMHLFIAAAVRSLLPFCPRETEAGATHRERERSCCRSTTDRLAVHGVSQTACAFWR